MFKIAIINQTKISIRGGAENWIVKIAESLYKLGIETDVICPYDKEIEDNRLEFINEITYRSKLYDLLKRISLYNFFYIFVHPNNKINIESYDLVYTISFYHSLLLLKTNKKIVIGTHDFFITNSKFGIDTLIFPMKLLTKFISHKKNVYIHSLSSIQSNFLADDHSKIYEIGNNFMAKQIVPVYNENFTICFIGKLQKRKGADTLIKLAYLLSNYKDIHLYIIGRIEKDYSKFICNLGYGNIKFVGYASEETKNEILSKSHLMLMLSKRESFPIVAVEGLSAGLSIITTWKPLTIIQKDYPVFYSEDNPEKIIKHIIRIKEEWLQNKEVFHDKMIKRARNFYDESQTEIVKLINDLIN